MPRWNIFKQPSDLARARCQVMIWSIVPTMTILILLTIILPILQSSGVISALHYSFDRQHQAFINHSLWWIVCVNITSALLTVAVVGWIASLYFAPRSLRRYWRLSRAKSKKARQKRALRWGALALVIVPVALAIAWFGIGQVIRFVTAPETQTLPLVDSAPAGIGYWSVPIPAVLAFLWPLCLIVAIYLTVKRSRL